MVLYNYLIANIAKDSQIDYVYRIQDESYFDSLIEVHHQSVRPLLNTSLTIPVLFFRALH